MKYVVVIFAIFLHVAPAGAAESAHRHDDKSSCTLCEFTSLDKLIALLADDILRDIVCRVSSQPFEAGTLAKAIGKTDTSGILERIKTLRNWGLLRWRATKWGTKVVEPVPGEGARTLRYWTKKYCFDADSCGTTY